MRPSDERDGLFSRHRQPEWESGRQSEVSLWRYSGGREASYRCHTCRAGIYIVSVEVHVVNSYVRLYASTTPLSDRRCPRLPPDPRVRVVGRAGGRVTVAWPRSPTDAVDRVPVRYCVAVNRREHFRTHCSARAHVLGETPPTRSPGFGFSWERAAPPVAGREPDRPGAVYRCVAGRTSFTLPPAGSVTRLYVDVFVENLLTSASSVYPPLEVISAPPPRRAPLNTTAPLTTVHLKRQATAAFSYHNDNHTDVSLALRPCAGARLRVAVRTPAGVWRRRVVRRTTAIVLRRAGRYYIDVTATRNRSASFTVVLSPGRGAYPTLPEDDNVTVVPNTTLCHSLTLSWSAISSRHQYCLYALPLVKDGRRVKDGRSKQRRNSCRPPPGKLLCRHAHSKRGYLRQRVAGLRPDTTYVFRVLVRDVTGMTSEYRHVTATTAERCDVLSEDTVSAV